MLRGETTQIDRIPVRVGLGQHGHLLGTAEATRDLDTMEMTISITVISSDFGFTLEDFVEAFQVDKLGIPSEEELT